jgi:hypothetical protein
MLINNSSNTVTYCGKLKLSRDLHVPSIPPIIPLKLYQHPETQLQLKALPLKAGWIERFIKSLAVSNVL